MPAKDLSSPARLAKRSRASDTALDNLQTKQDRTKRRRTSTCQDEGTTNEQSKSSNVLRTSQSSNRNDTSTSTEVALSTVDKDAPAPSGSWALSRCIAGQFTNLDPVLTPDEQYIFLGLETAIHVYSVTTSRLFRIIELESGDSVIGYRLSPFDHERLYIFTLNGSVGEWEWASNKQTAHWNTAYKTTAADIVHRAPGDSTLDAHNMLIALRKRKDGKRELIATPLNAEKLSGTVILETDAKLDGFKIIGSGEAVVAYGDARLFFGSSCSTDPQSPRYAWREIKLATPITCIDINYTRQHAAELKKTLGFDLALGGADGSVLIYHDASNLLGTKGNNHSAPRRLHWHRDPVTAVRWSRDSNYVLSGGHESVMVLWQLDTGRKQFLPHLSSPICNIVVSGSGNSYAIKLADNRVIVLSARELQPLATITSLQLCAPASRSAGAPNNKASHVSRMVTAALHPQHPEQLLVTVPAVHQLTPEGITSTSAPVLQTYDIRSGGHISRQALARTNATTLNIGPDGSQILTPDIKHLGISGKGKWMATVDSWSPCPEDTEALNIDSGVPRELEEIYLKFWLWNEASSIWQLVTRIDSPHPSNYGAATVLDMAPRPGSYEFATVGSDGSLRLWRPVVRQRHGLSKHNEQPPETWKCRNTLDLTGYMESRDAEPARLSSASVCFSEDGSVLAVSFQSMAASPGLAILVDVRNCSVRYSQVGVYSGDICATAFLGCSLLVATQQSVFAWDTVNDLVSTIDPSGAFSAGDNGPRLLAVNPRTRTFATAGRNLHRKTTSKKIRKSGSTVYIYDIDSLSLLSCFKLAKEPVALLSNPHSTDYVVVDASANVQQINCASKGAPISGTDELVQYPEIGLEGLFGRHLSSTVNKSANATNSDALPSERNGLADVFGDTPPFALPPSRIVFQDLHLPTPATLPLDNLQPSLVISAENGEAYEPSDSEDEIKIDIMPASTAEAVKSAHASQEKLTLQTTNPKPKLDDDEPKSVIHAPAGFNGFGLNVQQAHDGSATSWDEAPSFPGSPVSVKEKREQQNIKISSNSPLSPPPLTTSIEPATDWSERATPRAQTRQDFDEIDRRTHSSNLEDYFPAGSAEITALQAALVECWSLCNTLATLSSIHRERARFAVDAQDDAWKSCWRLCKQLYAGQVDDNASQVNPTLDLCRDFCQTLFETRARDDEISDSVLRVSFELNNHLFNTHDRNLPDAFRERTLDFYITLCHRLMKQRTRVPETDVLLSACWSLAEMLFSIRQSKKERRPLDEELLGSAVQACWELCDIFREGWTQRSLRNSDRGTPRPSQATFTPAENQAKQSDVARVAEAQFHYRNPETPTTIFEDIGTVSPEEGPVQNIFLLGQRRGIASHTNWPSNVSSVSGRTYSSDRTSSTSTVITLSNDPNVNGLKVLVTNAALNNGYRRNESQSFPSFVKSLSSDAFGTAPWQAALLRQYKALVASEPAVQIIGTPTRASARDIAMAVKFMARDRQYLWLHDLYRLVFGFHVEEGVNRDSIMLQT
ncbi:hypothetical protein BDV18DRAFT_154541 [Aspergillus unguis]